MARPEKYNDLILKRLRLAQALLEESDKLPGASAYQYNESLVTHPRHALEGLCIYLLLTCFDLLGQKNEYIQFQDWLVSTNRKHLDERDKIIAKTSKNTPPTNFAKALFDGHGKIYGVRRSFMNGIDSLPCDARQALFDSVEILVIRELPDDPNTSPAGHPFEEGEVKREKLISDFIYQKRNAYTHRLDGDFFASLPIMSNKIEGIEGGSFYATISNGRLYYGGGEQTRKLFNKRTSAYVFCPKGWPFVLFKIIYKSIGIEFDPFSIGVTFSVRVIDEDALRTVFIPRVSHVQLRDPQAIYNQFFGS